MRGGNSQTNWDNAGAKFDSVLQAIPRSRLHIIDSLGNRINMQTFSLPKSIEGLPSNNSALTDDVIATWKSEESKRKAVQKLEGE